MTSANHGVPKFMTEEVFRRLAADHPQVLLRERGVLLVGNLNTGELETFTQFRRRLGVIGGLYLARQDAPVFMNIQDFQRARDQRAAERPEVSRA